MLLLYVSFLFVQLVVTWVLGSVLTLAFGRIAPMSVPLLLVSLVAQSIDAGATVVIIVLLARIFVQRRTVRGVPNSGT